MMTEVECGASAICCNLTMYGVKETEGVKIRQEFKAEMNKKNPAADYFWRIKGTVRLLRKRQRLLTFAFLQRKIIEKFCIFKAEARSLGGGDFSFRLPTTITNTLPVGA